MSPEDFLKEQKLKELKTNDFIQNKAPRLIGIEMRLFFKGSFENKGFTDKTLTPWQAAKRTDSANKWYGFSAGATSPLPDDHPRRNKSKKKYKARKEHPVTNYSPTAPKRATLSGITGDLKDSLQYEINANKATVSSNLPYADVHNEGLTAMIFGKKEFTMPKRQFIGDSESLMKRIDKVMNELD